MCKLATLPERNAVCNRVYILRSNCYKIIAPLTTARLSTSISLKFITEGIIGRLSTSETTLVQSKLLVAVENLRKGHIQVILLNTSATSEASIIPGTITGELSFHHAFSPLLYWREDLLKNSTTVSLAEGKRQPKMWKAKKHNRCDNVANWRASREHTPNLRSSQFIKHKTVDTMKEEINTLKKSVNEKPNGQYNNSNNGMKNRFKTQPNMNFQSIQVKRGTFNGGQNRGGGYFKCLLNWLAINTVKPIVFTECRV